MGINGLEYANGDGVKKKFKKKKQPVKFIKSVVFRGRVCDEEAKHNNIIIIRCINARPPDVV